MVAKHWRSCGHYGALIPRAAAGESFHTGSTCLVKVAFAFQVSLLCVGKRVGHIGPTLSIRHAPVR